MGKSLIMPGCSSGQISESIICNDAIFCIYGLYSSIQQSNVLVLKHLKIKIKEYKEILLFFHYKSEKIKCTRQSEDKIWCVGNCKRDLNWSGPISKIFWENKSKWNLYRMIIFIYLQSLSLNTSHNWHKLIFPWF